MLNSIFSNNPIKFDIFKRHLPIDNYEGDITHIIRKPPLWWKKTFERHGWKVELFKYSMPPIKENWTIPYPKGNGFFILKKN